MVAFSSIGEVGIGEGDAGLEVTTSAIEVSQSFGTSKLNRTLPASGFTQSQTIGTAQVNCNVTATGISQETTLGTAKINRQINCTGIAVSQAIGTAQLNRKVTLGTGVSVSQTLGTAKVNENIACTGISQEISIGSISSIDRKITCTSISNAQAIGTAQLNRKITCTGISQTTAAGMPDVNLLLAVHPDTDTSIGSWTNEVGATSNLYQSIDEDNADDNDYIQSEINPSHSIAKFKLAPPNLTMDQPLVMKYRFKKNVNSGSANVTVTLLQGVSTIATWNHTDITASFVTAQQTLTSLEAASISNFTDLYIQFEATGTG